MDIQAERKYLIENAGYLSGDEYFENIDEKINELSPKWIEALSYASVRAYAINYFQIVMRAIDMDLLKNMDYMKVYCGDLENEFYEKASEFLNN